VRGLLPVAASLLLAACDLGYPEIAVVNRTAPYVLLRSLSFSGCKWEGVLAFGEASSLDRCLPGEDRIHFQKLDAQAYCREQAADGAIEGVCPCDAGTAAPDAATDPGLVNQEPFWFNYQTVSAERVGYGELRVLAVTPADMEQDFSVPGPYGH
jgi:hypothetical protein